MQNDDQLRAGQGKRHLASLQRIENIEPIAGADHICMGNVLGWQVIIGKEDFKNGDLCIFFEIDSLLHPELKEKFSYVLPDRVKKTKIRGVYSFGLAVPLGALLVNLPLDCSIGDDLTTYLGVRKYIPPCTLRSGENIAEFPAYVPKTDEVRIQSNPNCLEEIYGLPYYITEKIDGTSSTFASFKDQFFPCSRTYVKSPASLYGEVGFELQLDSKLHDGFAIQGEIAGPGIQKNLSRLDKTTLNIFDVYDIYNQRYMEWDQIQIFINDLELQSTARVDWRIVPLIEIGASWNYSMRDLIFRVNRFRQHAREKGEDTEGIVCRPIAMKYSPTLMGRLSFKVVAKECLAYQ